MLWGGFPMELWALLNTGRICMGLGAGYSSPHSLVMFCGFSCPELPGALRRAHGQGTRQEGTLPHQYYFSILVLHAARVSFRPYQHKLWIGFAAPYWNPIVILYDFWWLSNRNDLVLIQVFLTQAKLIEVTAVKWYLSGYTFNGNFACLKKQRYQSLICYKSHLENELAVLPWQC